MVGSPKAEIPHILKRITRVGEAPTDSTNSKLVGDYLMFRIDDPGRVRPAFFRFYPHENGERIRSMGLRLDDRHGKISSKGWAVRQNNQYMVAGYIITRDKKSTVPDGGFSLMNVSDDAQNRLLAVRNGTIEMSTVLHMQSTFEAGGSASRGILIRLLGAENEGGQRDQTKERRHAATLEFQQDLIDRFGHPITLTDVSRILEQATGCARHHFAFTSEMRPSEVSPSIAKSMHTGTFLNGPVRCPPSGDWASNDFSPLEVLRVTEGYDTLFLNRNKTIGVDFINPPRPFRKS